MVRYFGAVLILDVIDLRLLIFTFLKIFKSLKAGRSQFGATRSGLGGFDRESDQIRER